jgi:hypothetical protein
MNGSSATALLLYIVSFFLPSLSNQTAIKEESLLNVLDVQHLYKSIHFQSIFSQLPQKDVQTFFLAFLVQLNWFGKFLMNMRELRTVFASSPKQRQGTYIRDNTQHQSFFYGKVAQIHCFCCYFLNDEPKFDTRTSKAVFCSTVTIAKCQRFNAQDAALAMLERVNEPLFIPKCEKGILLEVPNAYMVGENEKLCREEVSLNFLS